MFHTEQVAVQEEAEAEAAFRQAKKQAGTFSQNYGRLLTLILALYSPTVLMLAQADNDATTEWRRTMAKEARDAGESTALSSLPLISSYKSEKSLCGTERRRREQAAREREALEIRALEDEHSQRQALQRSLEQSGRVVSPRSLASPRGAKLTAEV